MRLLLDTHAWLWSLMEPARLSARARLALGASGNEVWVSAISAWEIALLAEKGRIKLDVSASEWVARAFDVAPLREAPVTREIALESRRLKLSHEDPADRFIAATARIHDLTLVTADARLRKLRGLATLSAARA